MLVLDDAPFDCLDAALRFAYRIEWEGVYPSSQIGKLHIRWQPNFTKQERRAQAAMIITHLRHHCSPVQRAYLECQYRMGPRRFSQINRLVRYVMSRLPASKLNCDLARELIYRYFRSGMSYEEIARAVACDVRTVTRYNEKLWRVMLALQAQTCGELEHQFREGGLIE
jgi:hypothetical protein